MLAGIEIIIIIMIIIFCFVLFCFVLFGPLRECRPIRSGASGLPYYCTTPVCVPTVLGGLAVCSITTNKKKYFAVLCCVLLCFVVLFSHFSSLSHRFDVGPDP